MSYLRLGSVAASLLMILTLTFVFPADAAVRGRKGKAVRAGRAAARGKKIKIVRGRARGARTRGNRREYASRRGRAGRNSIPVSIPRARGASLAIPPERVREIQQALQREGFLAIEPSGQYDKNTIEAMTNYQKNNGLRVTGYPTAESLQKLRLNKTRNATPSVNTNSAGAGNDSQPPSNDNLPQTLQ
jgi:Putative peptidoglycan binding domain